MSESEELESRIRAACIQGRIAKYPNAPFLHQPVEEFEVEVADIEQGKLVRISRMYGLDDLADFDYMQIVSDFFGTKNINVGEETYEPGCKTCDHGSEAALTLTVIL